MLESLNGLVVKIWKEELVTEDEEAGGYFQVLEQPEEWRNCHTSVIAKGDWTVSIINAPAINVESGTIYIRGAMPHRDNKIAGFPFSLYDEIVSFLRSVGCVVVGKYCDEDDHDYIPIEACGFVYQICRKCQKQQEEEVA